jgi:hypothetical protein
VQRNHCIVPSSANSFRVFAVPIGVMDFSVGGEVAFLSVMRFDPDATDAVARRISPRLSEPRATD